MKKKKLIVLCMGLILALALTTTGILAWLTDTKSTPEFTLTVGEVKYQWNTGTTKTTPVVPGENIVTSPYKLSNQSTVTSEIRMTYTITNQDNEDVSNLVTITFASNWVLVNGIYYYQAGSTVDGKYPILPTTTEINVITGIKLNGALVGNEHANQIYTFTFTFQAKQNDFVTWENLGSIDFTTGLGQ